MKISTLLNDYKKSYPAGEITFPLKEDINEIVLDIPTPEAIVSAVQISWNQDQPIILKSYYVPNARADKPGNFDIKAIAKILSTGNFSQVITADIHSPVSKKILEESLGDKFMMLTAAQILNSSDYDVHDVDCVIAPDKGAITRAGEVAWRNGKPLIKAEKVRNQETGRITHYQIDNPQGYRTGLVVDDICDGGATFKILAQSLPDMKLDMYVTHGVFSGNANNNLEPYSRIITTDSLSSCRNLNHLNQTIIQL